MRSAVDLRLVTEASRHALRFACEDCAHATPDGCAHGYPDDARPHRRDLDEEGGAIAFCKEFELA